MVYSCGDMLSVAERLKAATTARIIPPMAKPAAEIRPAAGLCPILRDST
jgi:hypothetical protein